MIMAAHRFDDQDLQMISFGMMQSAASSSNHANSSSVKEGEAYDMGELDQALFLYLDEHDQSQVQEHKQTLNIFPSQPMHVHPSSIKEDLSLLPSTSSSYKTSDEQSTKLGKGKEIKSSVKKEEKKKSKAYSSDHEGPKTPDAKTLRRLAQNREAARKSRLRKKAYIQQLENCRMKLMHLEHELQRTRTQGMFLNGGETNLSCSTSGVSSDATMFDMEHRRWMEEHHHLICDLRAAVQEQLSENELRIYVDKFVAHYDVLTNLKNMMIERDVFHLISGMWMSRAERCFMWIGGFRPSQLIKIILRCIESLSEQQLLSIYSLQQSTHETEEALSQGLEALHHALTDIIVSDTMENCMPIALSTIHNLEDFVRQEEYSELYRLHNDGQEPIDDDIDWDLWKLCPTVVSGMKHGRVFGCGTSQEAYLKLHSSGRGHDNIALQDEDLRAQFEELRRKHADDEVEKKALAEEVAKSKEEVARISALNERLQQDIESVRADSQEAISVARRVEAMWMASQSMSTNISPIPSHTLAPMEVVTTPTSVAHAPPPSTADGHAPLPM